MRGARKGERRSPDTEWKKGQHVAPDTEFKRGLIPWNKGTKGAVKWTPEQRARQRLIQLGKRRQGGSHWATHTCLVCGKTFETRKGEGRKRKYCSWECSKTAWSRSREGCKSLTAVGYIYIRTNGHRIMEHRLVMEQVLGRKLTKGEVVHHINGIKNDNRKENLVLMTNASHHALTSYLALLWTKEHPDDAEQITRAFTSGG